MELPFLYASASHTKSADSGNRTCAIPTWAKSSQKPTELGLYRLTWAGWCCQCPFVLRAVTARTSPPTPHLLLHRCRWEAHLRTKELSDTSPVHTCTPRKVGSGGPHLSGGGGSFPGAWLGPGCSFVSGSLWFCSVEDSAIRCEQLDMLLEWLADFRKSTSSSSTANPEELVAFDIVCGDLNFDNCSSGEAGFLSVQVGYWGRVGAPVTASNTGSSKNFLLLVSMWVGCSQD